MGARHNPAEEQAGCRAAILQHHIVMRIRLLMVEQGISSDAELAKLAGLSLAQMGRVLRGQSAMTLAAVTTLEVALRSALLQPAGQDRGTETAPPGKRL